MEVRKECCLINLQDEEDGKLYECMIPRGEYTKIMEGDYNLAIKYLQIEKKNRLPADEDLKKNCEIKQEQVQEINAQSFCEANITVKTESWETQNLSEYSELSQPGNESWRYNAVLALIASIATHQEDLNDPKKKKDVWSKVSNDLLSQQLTFSEKTCYNKWRSLVRSYRAIKDKRNLTGQKVSKFMFYNQMDDLLGEKKSIRSGLTIESSEESEYTTNTKKENNKKRSMDEFWTYDAVLALIASLETHHEDLNDPKKKKYVWSKVSNELISKQLKFSEKACYYKWRSLLSSYRARKNKKISNGPGQEATTFLFYDQMDNFLGHKPSICSEQAIESSEEPEASVSEINITDNTENTTNIEKGNKKSKMNELWTINAVLALLASVETHHEDLNHPKKKKYVWSKVSNDLMSKQFTFSENACYNKWRSLLRSYRSTKDKTKLTKHKKTKFMFYDQMDDLLSYMPSIRSGHTKESSEDSEASVLEINNTEDTSNTEKEYKKRKREPITQLKETAKQKRHEERMAVEETCYNKRRRFLRSYEATKDKRISSRQEATRFMSYDQMDELLGHMQTIRPGHTIESSEDSEGSVSEIIEINITGNTEDTTTTEKENNKIKSKPITQHQETCCAKQKRHEEIMAMEEKKIMLEERKLQLLQKLLDKI